MKIVPLIFGCLLLLPVAVTCQESSPQADPDHQQSISILRRQLQECDGATEADGIAAILDQLGAMGHRVNGQSAEIVALLSERADVFTGRDKLEVLRIRAYAMATLARIEVPDSAIPFIIDMLSNVDERLPAVEVGAAARAAGALGPRASPLVPFLIKALGFQFYDPEFSLEQFDPIYAASDVTTVRIEVIHALGKIRPPQRQSVIERIERCLANSSTKTRYYSRLAIEADKTIQILRCDDRNPSDALTKQFASQTEDNSP